MAAWGPEMILPWFTQVVEFLALERKRKAPQKWWCKPPANGE